MKTANVIALGVGTAIGIAVWNTARLADAGARLRSDIKGVTWKGISGGGLNLELVMQMANPSSKEIRLDGVYLDIQIGGSTIASINAGSDDLARFASTRIAGNAVNTIKLPVRVGLLSLAASAGTQVYKAITGGQLPADARITGEVKVNGIATAYDEVVPLGKGAVA
jgi:hypothetical protein